MAIIANATIGQFEIESGFEPLPKPTSVAGSVGHVNSKSKGLAVIGSLRVVKQLLKQKLIGWHK